MHFPSLFQTAGLAALARIIGLLGIAALLGACSAVQLGYNNLPNVAYWWLDSYIDFNDEQAVLVREDLRRLHAWHRSEELPRLQATLARIEELAPDNISPQQACTFVPAAFERLNAILVRAEPALVTLAMGLAPEQLAHLQRKYERNNADYRKEWVRLAPAQLREKRFRQFVDRAEKFYGPLEEPQLAALRREVNRSTFDPRRALAERERRQEDLLATLRRIARQPLTIADARALLHGYFERAQAPPDAAQRAAWQSWVDEGCRSFSAMHNATTAVQRQQAVGRLRGFQRDLRELASQM